MAKIIGEGIGTITWGTRWNYTIEVRGAAAGYGQGGNDVITGDGAANKLVGQAGRDSLYGKGGNDFLDGGIGNDRLFGGAGNDLLWGGAGNDWLEGGAGNDRLRGGAGNDTLISGPGTDDLQGGSGNDTLIYNPRPVDDLPSGTARFDGGTGRDTLIVDAAGTFTTEFGETARYIQIFIRRDGTGDMRFETDPDEPDIIPIGSVAGIETFRLNSDDNVLDFISRTTVTAYGGNGADRFEGREGNQTFIGGSGGDDYRFLWREGMDGGYDKIIGFNAAEGDAIGYSNRLESLEGPEVVVTALETGGHTIYTSTVVETGEIVHTLDVDAINLPEPYFDYYLG